MSIIFLDKNTTQLDYDTNINIILSPEFYWVRLFDIPIGSKSEVLKVVPNLFEDYFNTDGYSYYVIKKEDGKYLCFAYQETKILEQCKLLNIDCKKINNIYFAQNEFTNIENAIELGTNRYIYQDDILIQIPQNMNSFFQLEDFDISSIKLSNHTISINRTSKYINNTTAYILSTIFILFSMVIFTKSFTIKQYIDGLEDKKIEIRKEYNLMASTIQTKAILNQYNNSDKQYIKLRDTIQYITNFKKSIVGKLEKIEFKNNTIECIFSQIDKNKISKYLQKKYKIKLNYRNNKVMVKIIL
jgi:hypothetical protein